VRTQEFLLAQYRALAPSIALEAGEVDLATLPVFVLANLAAGVTTVIADVDLRRPGAVDGAKVWAQIKRCGVTRITASPAFFERLVVHAKASGETLRTIDKLHTGGAPVFPRLLVAMRGFAPSAKVVAVYGSTEAEPIAHFEVSEMSDEDQAAMRAGRGLLAGMPVPEVRLRVVRDRWGEARGNLSVSEFANEVLPTGRVGEIVVAGDHVLKGYLGGLGDTETKFRVDGEVWHRTGDAGCFDEGGRLWLQGRCAARLDDGRGELYPFGVECVAMIFPEVRRAAVLAHKGKRVLAVEADRGKILEKKLLDSARWALIDEIIFVDAMPVDRRHNAKIDYGTLRAWLGTSLQGGGN
jgi:acyl-CoA synthetase (AMP-forming)/AMP-acid ligase II